MALSSRRTSGGIKWSGNSSNVLGTSQTWSQIQTLWLEHTEISQSCFSSWDLLTKFSGHLLGGALSYAGTCLFDVPVFQMLRFSIRTFQSPTSNSDRTISMSNWWVFGSANLRVAVVDRMMHFPIGMHFAIGDVQSCEHWELDAQTEELSFGVASIQHPISKTYATRRGKSPLINAKSRKNDYWSCSMFRKVERAPPLARSGAHLWGLCRCPRLPKLKFRKDSFFYCVTGCPMGSCGFMLSKRDAVVGKSVQTFKFSESECSFQVRFTYISLHLPSRILAVSSG